MESASVCARTGVAAAAAVLLFFMAVAAFWRWAAKRGSENAAQPAADHEDLDHACLGDGEVPAAIFLSHSGKQKPFVENLYEALRSANRSAFFDQITLPKGSRFPPRIKRAARGCKLGVVVLSEDFFTSKWPMLELEMLVLERAGPDASVLPLFYELQPEDLKCANNLSRWRRAWKRMVGRQQAEKWEQAVKNLRAMNGEIFVQETSEADYRRRVVSSICKRVPSRTPHDLSHIQGHQRLAQDVARRFEDARQCDEIRACMVGLHGEGGLGKTTLCQIMVNFFDSHEYPGRSHLLEFPSPAAHGHDRLKNIVQECKRALRQLTDLSYEHVLNQDYSFEQVVQLMKENLRRFDVFLAIDNVWEGSREEAAKILGVSFSARSKILVTSRSEEVLKDLLITRPGHTNTRVGPLPAPDHEEAFQIFQETSHIGDLNSSVARNKLEDLLKNCCMFSGIYHALALKALGHYVRSVCKLEGLEKIEDHLSLIRQEIKHSDLQTLDKVIRLSYEVVQPEHKKHMFLDIAVLPIQDHHEPSELTYTKALQWLRLLYKEIPKIQIVSIIDELALAGLIQLNETVGINGRTSEKMIRVHDLYSDLAQREAAKSSRFLTKDSTALVEKIEWAKLERVVLVGNDRNSHLIEMLQQTECQKLQVLSAVGIELGSLGLHLDLMRSLCVLKLQSVTLRSIQNWSAATGLAIVVFRDLVSAQPLEPMPHMSSLEGLIIASTRQRPSVLLSGPPNIKGCQHLKELVVDNMSSLFGKVGEENVLEANYFNWLPNLEILSIGSLNRTTIRDVLNLNTLVRLQELAVSNCEFLERIDGLDALKNLRQLSFVACPCLKDVDGLSGSVQLQLEILWVKKCASIKKLPDLSALTRLERLLLWENKSLEEVGGLSSTLKDLTVTDRGALKKMPDLSALTRIERLQLQGITCLEEVGGLSSTLKDLTVADCGALKKMPDLSALTRLERLQLKRNKSLEEVGGLSSTLKEVSVTECGALKKMPDLSALTRLQRLQLWRNKCLEEVGGLSSTLKEVSVTECGALQKMPDLSALTCLERLQLWWNKSLEEVGGEYLPSTLQHLSINGCSNLRNFPSCNDCVHLHTLTASSHHIDMVHKQLPALGNLRDLTLEEGEWTSWLSADQWKRLSLLRSLEIRGSESAKIDVGCLGPLTHHLKELQVWECEALEEIGDLSALHSLEELVVGRCPRLKRLGGFTGVLSTRLKRLRLYECGSLEASTIPVPG